MDSTSNEGPSTSSGATTATSTHNTKHGQGKSNMPYKPRFNKRPFNKRQNTANTDKQSGPPEKRSKASFDRQPEKSILYTYPLSFYFMIQASFTGVNLVISNFYNALRFRDSKLTSLLPELELKYAVVMSVIYRCGTVCNRTAAKTIRNLDLIGDSVRDLMLPDFLCKYIESFGSVKLSSGINVIPYFADYHQLQGNGCFYDPKYILQELGKTSDEHWSHCPEIIDTVHDSMSRALKGALRLRKVDYENVDGRDEFLAAYSYSRGRRLNCFAPQQMEQSICQLGACYQFRNVETAEDWKGNIKPPYVLGAPEVDQSVTLKTIILAGLAEKSAN
jgi:hypothetical protein